MKKTFAILLVVVAAIVLSPTSTGQAWSRILWTQIIWPTVASDRVVVLASDGLHFATVGANLAVDKSQSTWAINAASGGGQSLPIKISALSRNADGTWQIPTAPQAQPIITRNGLVMLPAIDYTISGQVVTFTAAQGSLATDIVGALYQ